MKKEVLLILVLISLLALGGCVNFLDKISSLKEKIRGEKEELIEELIGPAGCIGQECEKYCQENPTECQKWCQENPEPCKKMLKKAGHEISSEFPSEGFPEGFSPENCMKNPQECIELCEKYPEFCPKENLQQLQQFMMPSFEFTGPGNCKDPVCIQQYCQQNLIECTKWCEENPEICSTFMGGETTEIIEPPAIKIKYAKTVNLNADQFREGDIIKAKELRANMITIWPARIIKNDEVIFFPDRVSQAINFVYQQGLLVELRNSYGGNEEEPKNYKKFRENVLKHVAEYAKFAEKHKVYRIVPFGEIDNNMINYQNKITELSKEMLTEMRKYYSGQIGIGVVAPWRDSGFTFQGYDYLTISAYPHNDVLTSVNWAREVADRSNIKILHIGETGVINPEDSTSSQQFFQTLKLSKEKEAEFYQRFFEQISNKVNGISIFYNSIESFMSVYEDPAEEVVNEWYNKIINSEEKGQETKLIVANPIDLSQITRISKFRSCAGHDYSGLNINLEKEPISSMKHYIAANKQLIGAKDTVKIFAPFDGKITEILESDGKQIFISANKAPKWQFIFFHTSPLPNIQVGASVKAGQLIGQGYMREWDGFDIAFKQFSFRREIFDSPFMHMSNEVLKEYELRGVTIENIIILKEFRENNPCPIKGTRDGEEAFTGETEKEDFIILK